MTLEPDPSFPHTAHATGADMILAQQIVDSPEALGVYAACEWDELGDDGKEWIAVIVRIAQAQATRALEAEVYSRAIDDAAKACEDQRQDFLSPEYTTGQPLGSFSERFACGECAASIRALAKELG